MDHNRFDYSPIIKRKPLKWPNGARVAVWIIPNIEHYEFEIPSFGLHPMTNLVPDVLNYAWREYSVRVGVWRLMDLLDKYKIRGTVALNSAVCDHYPIIIEEGKKRGWEFMGHGVVNSRPLNGLSETEERKVIRETVQTITKSAGAAPQGWLGPGLAETFNTPDFLAEEGITYLCDWCNDDQPYPMKVKKGRLISIPYSVEINDIPFYFGLKGSPADFMQAIQDQFDLLYAEGETHGRVMAIALHPFITNVPYRQKYFERALEYITRHESVWLTTGGEIAKWYYDNYYATA